MANGDNYFTPKSSFQGLMNILNQVGDVTSTIQKGRDRRSNALLIRIDSITGTRPNEIPLYKRYTNPIDNFRIEEMIIELKNKVGTDINRTNLDTQEYYKDRIRAMELQIKDNQRFAIDKASINGIQKELIDAVDSHMKEQEGIGGDELRANKRLTVEKIENLLVKYGNKKESIIGSFSDRIAADKELENDIMTAEDYAQFILSELEYPSNGDVGYLSKQKANIFRKGLFEGNMGPMVEGLKTTAQTKAAIEAQWRGEADDKFSVLNQADYIYNSNFGGDDKNRIEKKKDIWIQNQAVSGIYSSDEEAGEAFDAQRKDAKDDRLRALQGLHAIRVKYNKSFDIDYVGQLLEDFTPEKKSQGIPQSIIDIESNIIPRGEVFKDLVKDNTKTLQNLYDNILHKKKKLGGNFREDGDFMNQMELFIDLYEELDYEIQQNEDAKKAGFTSAGDVYSKIDIELIKSFIKK